MYPTSLFFWRHLMYYSILKITFAPYVLYRHDNNPASKQICDAATTKHMKTNKGLFALLILTAAAMSAQTMRAQTTDRPAGLSAHDLNAPMGWATCTSLTSGDDYQLTGGASGNSITLTASGGDDCSAIENAIKNYPVIVFDGSAGDFILSRYVTVNRSDRTFVGINNARLCTQFYVSDDITRLMDDNNVKSLSSSSGTGGTLSNGTKVGEARETKVRQLLIDYTGDSKESYRNSGIFYISGESNIIIRNIHFVGPGAIDVGGYDLVSILNGAHHIWVDHCHFTDGMDGNLDVTVKADFVTISWCKFDYTQRSYDHKVTNLVGGSDDANKQGEHNLNITYAHNLWGNKCEGRMPMARFGTIHLLNNYYNCPGCGSSVNPRKNSEFLIEGNYFEKGVKNIFTQGGAKAYVFKNNHYTESFSQPANKSSVHLPYSYTAFDVMEVPTVITSTENGAGPTLTDPLAISAQAPADKEEDKEDDDNDSNIGQPGEICYLWQSPNGTPEERGGTATGHGVSEGRINYTNADYYTLSVNAKKENIHTDHILITLDHPLQATDLIEVTAYRNKDTDANGTLYYLFDNGHAIDEGDDVVWNNIYPTYGQTPNTIIHPIGDGAGSRTIKIARSKSGTNVFITRLAISHIASGIAATTTSSHTGQAIYTLQGQRLDASHPDALPRGIYIVNGKKMVVR